MATALPMPELAPVTIAFWPRMRFWIEQAGMTGSGKLSWINFKSGVEFIFDGFWDSSVLLLTERRNPSDISQIRILFLIFSGNKNPDLLLTPAEPPLR